MPSPTPIPLKTLTLTTSTPSPTKPGTSNLTPYISAEIYSPPSSQPASTSTPTILLLPFWGGTAATYTPIQSLLATHLPTIPSIAVSYMGTGNATLSSPHPLSSPSSSCTTPNSSSSHPNSIASLTHHLLHLLQSCLLHQQSPAINTRALVVVGHSMGAKIALSLLSNLLNPNPESIAPPNVKIRGVLLLAPAPPSPLVLPKGVREGQLAAYESLESARGAVEGVLVHEVGRMDGEVVRGLVEGMVGMSRGAKEGWLGRGGMGGDLRGGLRGVFGREEVSGEGVGEGSVGEGKVGRGVEGVEGVERVKIKVLAGVQDKVERIERVEEETVGFLREVGFEVDVRRVEECGHLIPLEKPEVVVEELVGMVEGI